MTDTCAHTLTSDKYLKFLAAMYQAKDAQGHSMLLASEDQRLLEFITVQSFLNKPLSMMQIMMSREVLFLGASTISRKVDALRLAGWVRTVADAGDRRIKWLEPTEKALHYFQQVDALLAE